MTDLTDEEAKALLAECDNPDCLTCEYARALLAARADAQAAVALAIERAAETVGLNAWKHEGEDAYSKGMDAGARHQAKVIYDAILSLAPADGLAAVEALRERAEKAEQERDAAVRGRNDWRDDFKALAAAIVGDTGLSAMTVAAQARTFRPRAEAADAERDRLAAELAAELAAAQQREAGLVEHAALLQSERDAWRKEPESSEAWCFGNQYALDRLCHVLGVDPDKVDWDGSDGSLDEEADSLINRILRANDDADGNSPDVAALIAEARREGWNAAIEAGAYEVAELFEHIAEERGSRDGARQAKRIAAAIRALKETTHD